MMLIIKLNGLLSWRRRVSYQVILQQLGSMPEFFLCSAECIASATCRGFEILPASALGGYRLKDFANG